jgi:hypothetical protein
MIFSRGPRALAEGSGRPLGTAEFVTGLERLLGRPIARRAPGRKPTASVAGLQLEIAAIGIMSMHFETPGVSGRNNTKGNVAHLQGLDYWWLFRPFNDGK